MKWLLPITLENERVALLPMQEQHREGIKDAAADGELWNLWYTSVPKPDAMDTYFQFASREQKAGRALPFVIFDKEKEKIVGCTRYCNAEPQNRRLEIGYTWYAKSAQRSHINTTAKLLLLTHAFEQLDAIAVEFRTHWLNHQSRQAILRLGAKQDGILRSHRIQQDGSIRDTVVFSVIRSEWPAVKTGLQHKLSR